MKKFAILLILLFMTACASAPTGEKSASTSVSFKKLIDNPDSFVGMDVTFGGYILDTKNLNDKAVIEVLQTPLTGVRKVPGTKENSEGRFTASHEGFLDPAEYGKDRMVTVSGTFMGCQDGRGENCSIKSSKIRLWPEVDPRTQQATQTTNFRSRNPFNDPYYYGKGAGGFP